MVYMKRIVNQKIRYYNLILQKNLFYEYIVENIYGSIYNKKPTGKFCNFFKSKEEALAFIEQEINRKKNNGYEVIKDSYVR